MPLTHLSDESSAVLLSTYWWLQNHQACCMLSTAGVELPQLVMHHCCAMYWGGGCLPSYCHTVVKGLLWSKSGALSISLLCWNSRSTQALTASFSTKSPCLDPNTTSLPCLPCPPLTALVFHEGAIFPPVFMIIFLPILLSSWCFLLVPLFTVCRGLGSSYLQASSLLNKALRLHSLPLRYSN